MRRRHGSTVRRLKKPRLSCRRRSTYMGGRTRPQIPFGLLHVNAEGRVLDHADPRHRDVIGRPLFNEAGPFGRAPGLRESLRTFLAGGEACCRLEVSVGEDQGAGRVALFFGRICSDLVLVRITIAGAARKDEPVTSRSPRP
jgi:hypothetical protein